MTTTMASHLLERGYDLTRYPTSWVTDTQLTVPLFDFSGKLKGYQTYTPGAPKTAKNPHDAKYFTRMMGHGQLCWGTELELEITGSTAQNNRISNGVGVQSVCVAQRWF